MMKDYYKGCAAFWFCFNVWASEKTIYLTYKKWGIDIYKEQ